MKFGLAQINVITGNVLDNTNKIIDYINKAKIKGIDVIIFPELSISGIGCEDLFLRNEFINANEIALKEIVANTEDITVILGCLEKCDDDLFNIAVVIKNKKIIYKQRKNLLSLKEQRYFKRDYNSNNESLTLNNLKFNITIGQEEINSSENVDYNINIASKAVNLNKELKIPEKPIIFVNNIGIADELIFEGGSTIFKDGKILLPQTFFEETLIIYDDKIQENVSEKICNEKEEFIFNALVFGLKEYCTLANFKTVILGLSGGIDSAIVACIAEKAIGAKNVYSLSLPSMYSSSGSMDDAFKLAENLKIDCQKVPIKLLFDTYIQTVSSSELKMDLAEENLQARIRGNILMMHSNRYNHLLLTTGNKSEIAMGYCTLYGDTCGGLNLIADLDKTSVYKLARWINREEEIIPEEIITKPPSAELRPNQKDSDSLPEYDVLDKTLSEGLTSNLNFNEKSNSQSQELEKRISNNLIRNRYKVNQLTLSFKLTNTSIAYDVKYPIVSNYKI